MATLGPLLYIAIALLPWLGLPKVSFSLPLLFQSGVAGIADMGKAMTRSQVAGLELMMSTDMASLDSDSPLGYRLSSLRFGDFALQWDKQQPLQLLLADGSLRQALPQNYRQQKDGIALGFPQLQLLFHNREPFAGQAGLEVQMLWLAGQALPAAVRLPWRGQGELKNQQLVVSGQDGASYFSSLSELRLGEDGYLEIPLQHYPFIHQEAAKDVAGSKVLTLLWQQDQANQGNDLAKTAYYKLYRDYDATLLQNMQAAKAEEIPNPAWSALYLQLTLEQNGQPSYESVRQQMATLAVQRSWSSTLLSPYLGLEQATLEQSIRQDTQRVEQIRQGYRFGGAEFFRQAGQAGERHNPGGIGDLLFRYGYLQLLLEVVQQAVLLRSTTQNDEQRLHLLDFLWEVSQIYPRNGYVQSATIRDSLRPLLQGLAAQWQSGFAPGLSMPFVLDALRLLRQPKLGLEELAYPLALQLLRTVAPDGSLPQVYGQESPRIPFYYARDALAINMEMEALPHNISVVPGFWLWTAGAAQAFFERGQPIVVTAGNFPEAQGNKLLLLRGVYVFPQQVTLNGQPIAAASQIPKPRQGNEASWYYEPQNKYLAIELPASRNKNSEIVIR